jgi:UDP-3-O-[3-hydroxymyristoyl] N-acetylglucosamine deacetylase
VEHLLAAIMAVGIDNLTVAIDGPEVPVLDGSALPFVSLLMEAGVERQSHIKSCIEFIRPVTVSCADKCVTISPSSSFEISCQIRFEHPLLAYQEYDYTHSRDAFIREIAPARTFGFLKDVPWLLSQGLAKGGSLENSVVIGEDDILNKEGMRFPDEFVRHKVLDLIGDLALLGMPMVGRVEAVSSGHRMHALLIQKILEETSAWRVTHTEEVSPYPLSHALLLR